jgi:hypothetical protein
MCAGIERGRENSKRSRAPGMSAGTDTSPRFRRTSRVRCADAGARPNGAQAFDARGARSASSTSRARRRDTCSPHRSSRRSRSRRAGLDRGSAVVAPADPEQPRARRGDEGGSRARGRRGERTGVARRPPKSRCAWTRPHGNGSSDSRDSPHLRPARRPRRPATRSLRASTTSGMCAGIVRSRDNPKLRPALAVSAGTETSPRFRRTSRVRCAEAGARSNGAQAFDARGARSASSTSRARVLRHDASVDSGAHRDGGVGAALARVGACGAGSRCGRG